VAFGRRTTKNGQWTSGQHLPSSFGGDPCEFEKCLAVTKPFFHLDSTSVGGCDWVQTKPNRTGQGRKVADGGGKSGPESRQSVAVRAPIALFQRSPPGSYFPWHFNAPSPTFFFPAFSIMKEK